MLMVIRFCSPPYSNSASASAVSVLPTPDGPHSMNTPIGLDGLSSPARAVCTRLAMVASAWFWPITRLPRVSARLSTACTSFLTIRPTGMPVQSSTTVATACSSTLGRMSGVSPWCVASSDCRAFNVCSISARSAGGGAAAPSTGAAPWRSFARNASTWSTSAFSVFQRSSSPSRRCFSASTQRARMP